MSVISTGAVPFVESKAQWEWDTSGPVPFVTGYPTGDGTTFAPTKTGLLPADLRAFVAVPIQIYGTPPISIPDEQLMEWIRWAEDEVEQETSILLCQTWVASPPCTDQASVLACRLIVNNSSGYQKQGFDYDLADAGYDFFFNRAQDSGWMEQTIRYRPVQNPVPTPDDPNGTKRVAYIYPLLSEFFILPPAWVVEDHDFGFIRQVPAANTQMLPLFAMQLSFMGFTENVPGTQYFQYTAGLTKFDYKNRWSFMLRLVLCKAAITALSTIQGTINLGANSYDMDVDGLKYGTKYSAAGPYSGLINNYGKMADMLLQMARSKVSGPMFTML